MIFCVEDDRNIRELVVYTLSSTGMEAEGFEDGEVFFKALAERLPELILLDIAAGRRRAYNSEKAER